MVRAMLSYEMPTKQSKTEPSSSTKMYRRNPQTHAGLVIVLGPAFTHRQCMEISTVETRHTFHNTNIQKRITVVNDELVVYMVCIVYTIFRTLKVAWKDKTRLFMSEATYVYYMRDARICFTVSTIRYVRWFAVIWGWLSISLLSIRVCVFCCPFRTIPLWVSFYCLNRCSCTSANSEYETAEEEKIRRTKPNRKMCVSAIWVLFLCVLFTCAHEVLIHCTWAWINTIKKCKRIAPNHQSLWLDFIFPRTFFSVFPSLDVFYLFIIISMHCIAMRMRIERLKACAS